MRQLAGGLAIIALAVTGCAAVATTSSSSGPASAGTSHGAATAAGSGTATGHGGPAGSGSGLARWVVDGTFEAKGGSVHPLAGMVTFRDSATGHTVSVTVGASGKFSLGLAAGTYTAAGQAEHGDSPCSAPVTVTVQAGQLTQVSLVCEAS